MSAGAQARGPRPLYARLLRLRRLRIGSLASFLLVECTVAAAILLALAELVSWWAVLVLPAAVAAMVKINDLVTGPARAARQQAVAHAQLAVDRPVAGPRQPVDEEPFRFGDGGPYFPEHSSTPPSLGDEPELPPAQPATVGRPARSHALGTAVRRQMAVQLQRTSTSQLTGRHARRELTGGVDRRSGFNERHFRSA